MKIKSKGLCSQAVTASRPEPTEWTRQPCFSKRRVANFRFTTLSSTSRIVGLRVPLEASGARAERDDGTADRLSEAPGTSRAFNRQFSNARNLIGLGRNVVTPAPAISAGSNFG